MRRRRKCAAEKRKGGASLPPPGLFAAPRSGGEPRGSPGTAAHRKSIGGGANFRAPGHRRSARLLDPQTIMVMQSRLFAGRVAAAVDARKSVQFGWWWLIEGEGAVSWDWGLGAGGIAFFGVIVFDIRIVNK